MSAPLSLTQIAVRSILTRTSGYLAEIASHSANPYRGCALGASLCGVGCYVRHSWYSTRGRPWGSFVESKTDAGEVYRRQYDRERAWARRHAPTGGRMVVFLSSSTEPFQPAEWADPGRPGVTRQLLAEMVERPPDGLIVQSHSHRLADPSCVALYRSLSTACVLRLHLTIETDRDALPGLPRHASPIARRFDALRVLSEAGLPAVVTVAPLLPIDDPDALFARLGALARAVVIDHFVEGDGSKNGSRTLKTPLPGAMERVMPGSTSPAYRDRIVEIARRHMPGRVGVGRSGFAGEYE